MYPPDAVVGTAEVASAEVALREQARLLSMAHDAIIVRDPADRITYWSDGAERTYGWSSAEALGRDIGDLLATELPEPRESILAEVEASGEWRGELRHRARDGRPIVVESRWTVERDGDGRVRAILEINRDMTAQKAAQEAEREIEARYRSLFEHMQAGVARGRIEWADGMPVDWTYLEVNHAFGELTGLAVSPGMRVSEVVPDFPQTNRETLDLYASVAAGGPPVRTEVHLRHLGMWLESNVYSPAPSEFVSVFTVITERKQAEARLRESEELLEQVSSLAKIGGWELDLETMVVTYSRETARIHEVEYPYVPPVLSQGDEYYPPEAWPIVRAAVQAAIEHGIPYDMESPFITAKGRHIWVRVQGLRVVRDGKPVKLRGTFQDITERKLAEEALLRGRAELAEAQRIAHVGSWTMDMGRSVTDWSDEMFRLYGLEPGRPIPTREERSRFYDGDTEARVTAAVARVVTEGKPYDLEFTINGADGVSRRVVARCEPVRRAHGTVTELRGTITDVTELRKAQALLDQAQRAEMVGRLAGGIAHDFNNQLAAIGGFAEVLADGLAADDPRRRDIEAIRDAGLRAGALTRQLLAFGRRQALQPSVVDVGEVIVGLGRVLRSLVPASINIVLPDGAPTTRVRVDRAGLEQAIMNLVLNARDAMPGGGTITIGLASLAVPTGDPRLRGTATAGQYLQATIADTGSGIDPALLPHVFEPFFTTKAFGLGSGLGLSSVDGFVAQSGGFLGVESEPGVGSTFTILLPVTDELPTQTQGGPAAIPRAAGDETILLVEDEPAVRTITARLLRGLGYTVLEARDGDAALALGGSDARIDLLLTDLVMPGINGRQLSEKLTARFPCLPTLFMSGYAPETVIIDGILGPGVPFLHKPFTPATLAAGVREILDRGGRSQ
jgi:PAS domain S-box-containing protein